MQQQTGEGEMDRRRKDEIDISLKNEAIQLYDMIAIFQVPFVCLSPAEGYYF